MQHNEFMNINVRLLTMSTSQVKVTWTLFTCDRTKLVNQHGGGPFWILELSVHEKSCVHATFNKSIWRKKGNQKCISQKLRFNCWLLEQPLVWLTHWITFIISPKIRHFIILGTEIYSFCLIVSLLSAFCVSFWLI